MRRRSSAVPKTAKRSAVRKASPSRHWRWRVQRPRRRSSVIFWARRPVFAFARYASTPPDPAARGRSLSARGRPKPPIRADAPASPLPDASPPPSPVRALSAPPLPRPPKRPLPTVRGETVHRARPRRGERHPLPDAHRPHQPAPTTPSDPDLGLLPARLEFQGSRSPRPCGFRRTGAKWERLARCLVAVRSPSPP